MRTEMPAAQRPPARAAAAVLVASLLLTAVAAAPRAAAALSASATLSTTSTVAPFDYTISVKNTGTVPISTFWFAWTNVPAEYNFLPAPPTNISVPNNWFAFPTGPNYEGDGTGIEYYTFFPLQPGDTIQGLNFTSTLAPGHMHDTASSYPFPIDTAVVFTDYPTTGLGAFATVTVNAPEPASIALVAPAMLLLLRRRRHSLNAER
jgi:hypothetical protein